MSDFLKGDSALGYAFNQIWDFSNIFGSTNNFLSFKSFSNSWGNSYTKFAILDIKFGFNCGKSDLC